MMRFQDVDILRILCQAVMKFHGVGNPSKTPAEATALEMGRGPQQQHSRVCFGDR